MDDFYCSLCPRNCGALRTRDHGAGFCKMGTDPMIARAALHYDEEPVISGTSGSGAVFFSGCALKCVFCQNYDLSHNNFGERVSVERLREIYFELIDQGANNINLVNPTHFAETIIESLIDPLPVPVVWNSGGFEKVETLSKLEGRVQVYLPDLKYIDSDISGRYSKAPDYFRFASEAISEMVRQTGPVVLNDSGIIQSGTIIRHLILPGRTEESIRILKHIRSNYPEAWISLMAQYLPFGSAGSVDQLGRRLTQEEYDNVADALEEIGFEDGFVQELSSSDESYIPVFDLTGVLKKHGS